MESKTISYFDWRDIQKAICVEMNIDEDNFRDYHKVIGGSYKDLWHAWLKYFDDGVSNGIIKYNDLGGRLECKLEWVKSDGKEWLEPFVNAVYKVWSDNDIKYINYSW